MAIKTESRSIDGALYSVSQLPARRATKLLYKLLGVLGPAFGKIGAGAGKKLSIDTVDASALGNAIETLYARLPENELDAVMDALLYSLTKDGKPLPPGDKFDGELAGQVMTIGKILRFAFEVNFGDFFGVLREAQALAQATAEKASS